MDVAQPELCTGPVAESYPPQCGGPVIRKWDWADHKGEYEQVGKVRWGEFVIEGHYEGDEFVVTSPCRSSTRPRRRPSPSSP